MENKKQIITIISFSEQGTKLNRELKQLLRDKGYECESYAAQNYASEEETGVLPKELRKWIGTLWGERVLIFIGTANIAVRGIAPWVKKKATDSQVIVIDEKGQFVVPLILGQGEKGRAFVRTVSKCISGVPVFVSLQNGSRRFSVDEFIKRNGFDHINKSLEEQIESAVQKQKVVGFYSEYPTKGELPGGLLRCDTVEMLQECAFGIAVTREVIPRKRRKGHILYLIPKNISVGIGCKKYVTKVNMLRQLDKVLEMHDLKPEQVGVIASVDTQEEEAGLIGLARQYRVPLQLYSARRLNTVERVSSHSEFVEKIVGVDNVSERAAILAGEFGEVIQTKISMGEMTFALVQMPTTIFFTQPPSGYRSVKHTTSRLLH